MHLAVEKKDKMGQAAELFTTLLERVGKETVKEPSPESLKRPVCTICNKTFSSYQALGRHKSIHEKQNNAMLGDGAGCSSGIVERCASNYVCRKCSERFPDRKALGRHIHKHWREIFKKKPSAHRRKKLKPPVPLPHGTILPSGPMVLPTDKSKQLPVLLTSDDTMCSASMELVVANAAVHQPPAPDFETESRCGTVPKILNDTGAVLTAPKQIPQAEKYVFDLNMLPYETDVWEP